jgi:hypothetical protein
MIERMDREGMPLRGVARTMQGVGALMQDARR